MISRIDCPTCDAPATVEISGQYIRATREEPAEYPVAEIVKRDCVQTGDDACDATDSEIESAALRD